MKKVISLLAILFTAQTLTASCGSDDAGTLSVTPVEPEQPTQPDQPRQEETDQDVRNLSRATTLFTAAMQHYVDGQMKMADQYNPITGTTTGEADVWPYTAAIEACNSILDGYAALEKAGKKTVEGSASAYRTTLAQLYDGLEYYAGTFRLTSYTSHDREWTVYGVHRGSSKGGAKVDGDQNVYDDQEWLIRELLRSWQLTGEGKYLEKAEYLTSYVLDGWDCCPDTKYNAWGGEVGGITWGPSYCTKHACSNAPLISPLVWLARYYKDKSDEITYRTVGSDHQRVEVTARKSDYYLSMARKIYEWQQYYLRAADGIYLDMMGADNTVRYEMADGVEYRTSNPNQGAVGNKYTYNSGTMVSGGADLYALTGEDRFLSDTRQLYADTFGYFPKKNAKGLYEYTYSDFSRWFDDVLLRGWQAAREIGVDSREGISTFQVNLDYAWENYLEDNALPRGLTGGWSSNAAQNDVRAIVAFAYASEYAMLTGVK